MFWCVCVLPRGNDVIVQGKRVSFLLLPRGLFVCVCLSPVARQVYFKPRCGGLNCGMVPSTVWMKFVVFVRLWMYICVEGLFQCEGMADPMVEVGVARQSYNYIVQRFVSLSLLLSFRWILLE